MSMNLCCKQQLGEDERDPAQRGGVVALRGEIIDIKSRYLLGDIPGNAFYAPANAPYLSSSSRLHPSSACGTELKLERKCFTRSGGGVRTYRAVPEDIGYTWTT